MAMKTDIPPRPRTLRSGRASTIMDEWAAMEASLVTGEVDDLLDTAAARLAALTAGTVLPRSVVAEVLEALRYVDVARAHLRTAEDRIGTA
jgi:hypothetical protein